MSGAIVGALYGEGAVPKEWSAEIARASKLDLHGPAAALARVTREVYAKDVDRRRDHDAAFAAVAGL